MKPVLEPVKHFVQGYAGATYVSQQRCWTFPWNVYRDFKDKLVNIKKEIQFNIQECPSSVIQVSQPYTFYLTS